MHTERQLKRTQKEAIDTKWRYFETSGLVWTDSQMNTGCCGFLMHMCNVKSCWPTHAAVQEEEHSSWKQNLNAQTQKWKKSSLSP